MEKYTPWLLKVKFHNFSFILKHTSNLLIKNFITQAASQSLEQFQICSAFFVFATGRGAESIRGAQGKIISEVPMTLIVKQQKV